MPLYVVTKNNMPCHATFNEQEARRLFQSTVHSGQYSQVAMLVAPASRDMRVLQEAAQAPGNLE